MIDLTILPDGRTYEHEYNGWLSIFRQVAEDENPVVVNPPRSWVSLLYYLGAQIDGQFRHQFREDDYVGLAMANVNLAEASGRLRELVERDSALRPELVDALYKSDMEWRTVGRRHTVQREFKVTCNGSFFRPEVLDYFNWWKANARQVHRKAVIVPCAADKPYPAPLHRAVLDLIAHKEELYDVFIATGVLGLVPEWAWDQMPLYDSGLPNEWRVMQAVNDFFFLHKYDRVVVYSDFYGNAIRAGLTLAGQGWVWPVANIYQGDYLDLRSENCLRLLEEAL